MEAAKQIHEFPENLLEVNFFDFLDASTGVAAAAFVNFRVKARSKDGIWTPSIRCLLLVNDSGFSVELEKFIAEEVQSLEQVEILLLLSGNPHKWWSARAVYDVVKSNPASVNARLEELAARGIVQGQKQTEAEYRFSPADERIWKVVNELRDAYKERPVKVVQAIYSKPPDAVQEFARAFRVRKDR